MRGFLCLVIIFSGSIARAQLFTEWRVNGNLGQFPMLNLNPSPARLVVGNTYRLAFSNLPSTGPNSFQQWCNLLFKIDAPIKNQNITLNLQFFNFGGITPNFSTSFSFTPQDWIGNELIYSGISEMTTAWTDYNAGELNLAPLGGDLDLMELDIQFKRDKFYQIVLIPEPSSLSLMLAGGAVLIAGRRRLGHKAKSLTGSL